jgi:quercetin dioxygenase-like cupin family protein
MRSALAILATALLLGIAFGQAGERHLASADATPQPAAAVTISSEVLGRAAPMAVASPELALGRVTIMPGASIPIHHHPGTQIGTVVQGVLSYRVYSGEVTWEHAGQSTPTRLLAGQDAAILPGDTLIEPPDALHQGWNDGDTPVVIYLSTLFPAGAPRAILAEATPIP